MKNGIIEESWRDIAVEKINSIVPNAGNCLSCGKTGTVSIAEHLVTPVVTDPAGGVSIGGATYPQVMLNCSNCGNVRYFNYVILTSEDPQLDLEKPNG